MSYSQNIKPSIIPGHKYYISAVVSSDQTIEASMGLRYSYGGAAYLESTFNITSSLAKYSLVGAARAFNDDYGSIGFRIYTRGSSYKYVINIERASIQVIDLTQMFGTGKEPSTAAQFEAMFPSDYYPYNAGQLISCGPTSVVSTGFNLWDEEWENGVYLQVNGQPSSNPERIRSKNPIRVLPDTDYYAISPSAHILILEYDSSLAYLNLVHTITRVGAPFKTSKQASYIKFYTGETCTIYQNNICINFSDPNRNGTYLPYQKDELDLSWISELTYNDGTQDVQMFPNGLCSAGTVYDEVTPTKAIKRVMSIDLGNCTYNYAADGNYGTRLAVTSFAVGNNNGVISSKLYYSGLVIGDMQNAALWTFGIYNHTLYLVAPLGTTKDTAPSVLSGIILYYELTEPIEIPLSKTLGYSVQPGGTEQLLPDNQPGQTPVTTQIIMDVTYPLDAVGTLQNLPNNYTSLQVMDNFASSLAQALTSAVGATSITRNSNGTWTITITPAS